MTLLDGGLSENEALNQRTAASLFYRLLFLFCRDFSGERMVKKPIFVFWRPMPGSQNRVWELYFIPNSGAVEPIVAEYHGLCCYTGINFEGDGMWIGKKIPENVPEPLCRYDGKRITLYNFEHHKVDDFFLQMGDEVEIPEYQSINASTRLDGDVPMDASRYRNQAWVDG
ncbi:MAG: hypothetical protein NT118_15225 [Lentisphaerae bacterium]|nr:hypothetical protein [Lentisphaerota bacterium]